ncbi:hypothetical protein YT1_4869 [Rhodococcus ruber]|nr:hypothetical protein YT1_4869 [Rhodococcus ruber]
MPGPRWSRSREDLLKIPDLALEAAHRDRRRAIVGRSLPEDYSAPGKVTAVNMMGMMDQAHTLLHQLMMWLHEMGGMPMMNMPM